MVNEIREIHLLNVFRFKNIFALIKAWKKSIQCQDSVKEAVNKS